VRWWMYGVTNLVLIHFGHFLQIFVDRGDHAGAAQYCLTTADDLGECPFRSIVQISPSVPHQLGELTLRSLSLVLQIYIQFGWKSLTTPRGLARLGRVP